MKADSSRRDFLKLGSVAFGGAFLATHMSAVMATAVEASSRMQDAATWLVLDAGEVRQLSALADQIYPPDDSPGAAEIGAVRFMDSALHSFMAGSLAQLRSGLADLHERTGRRHPGVASFADLGFDQQTELLCEVESSGFFATVHFLTLAGVFALPEHGGNLDGEGWRQIGFERRHVWQPPFGYYDARYQQEAGHEPD